MGYRDELEALRARNEELEGEVAALREALGRGTGPDRWTGFLGAPTRLQLVGELEGELDEDALEELVASLRRAFGEVGRTEQLGRTLTWSTTRQGGRAVEVICRRAGGKTELSLHESQQPLIGGVVGAGLGGLGGGGMGFVVAFGLRAPGLLPVFILAWLLLVFLACRMVYARLVEQRRTQLAELLHRLETDFGRRGTTANRRADPARGPRIADDLAEAGREAEEDDEALAESPPEDDALSSPGRARR